MKSWVKILFYFVTRVQNILVIFNYTAKAALRKMVCNHKRLSFRNLRLFTTFFKNFNFIHLFIDHVFWIASLKKSLCSAVLQKVTFRWTYLSSSQELTINNKIFSMFRKKRRIIQILMVVCRFDIYVCHQRPLHKWMLTSKKLMHSL